jgi:dTMP kinase
MLVAVEGLDGAGKRTQSEFLIARAQARGLSSALMSFPRYHETESAALIAAYLNGEYGGLDAIDPHFPALLYALDRFESRDLVVNRLASCDLVVIDRYVASNLAYQAARVENSCREKFITWLASVEYDLFKLPPADLTLLLAVTPSVSRRLVDRKDRRVYTDAKADLHEKNDSLLQSCAGVYEELSCRQFKSKWLRIECTERADTIRKREEIGDEMWAIVLSELEQRAELSGGPLA